MGTTESVYSSLFCSQYKCDRHQDTNGGEMFQTKFNDTVAVIYKSGRINKILLGIAPKDSQYFPNDKKTFDAIQIQMFGRIVKSMPASCYDTDTQTSNNQIDFGSIRFNNTAYILRCTGFTANGTAAMLVGVIPRP